MHDLFLSEADLEQRRQNLPFRLKPLTPDPSYIQAAYQPVGRYGRAIALRQGQKGPLSYRDWRVSLTPSDVSIAYFEIWQYATGLRHPICYLLHKAYFHLYLPQPTGVEKELLFLHCDPQETNVSPHYRYKVGPHFHFEVAGSPWKNAHIPLCDGWQEQVLQGLDELDQAIARAIDFIADQFLPLIEANQSIPAI